MVPHHRYKMPHNLSHSSFRLALHMANAVAPVTNSTHSTAHASSASASSSASKRRKVADHRDGDRPHQQPLLPGLPDHIARLCLAGVPPSLLFSVCSSWRRVIYTPSFPPFLSLYALLSPSSPQDAQPRSSLSPPPSRSLRTDPHHLSNVEFATFDPIAARWRALPPPAPGAPLRLLVSHPSFLSWRFPIQTVSVAGKLVLLAATARDFFPAISRPLIFDPIARRWASGPPFTAPRRWCAAGVLGAAVYVASGIGSQFSTDVARSLERWDLSTSGSRNPGTRRKDESANWEWRKLNGLKDGRFCRDAIEAVGWRGKLCMVNVKGHAAKQGVVYDVAADAWRDMPKGMIGGWRGPVAAMDEDAIYVVDEVQGALRRYDEARDRWEEVMASDLLRGAQHAAAGGGRVCVVCGGDGGIAVVDVTAAPARMWVVDPPPAAQAVAVHILPRMSSSGDEPEDL